MRFICKIFFSNCKVFFFRINVTGFDHKEMCSFDLQLHDLIRTCVFLGLSRWISCMCGLRNSSARSRPGPGWGRGQKRALGSVS